jgi:sigma-E factor negative regulatory protein RseA
MKTEQIDDQIASASEQSEWLSALVDGEVRESEFDALFDAGGADADLHARWHCYQLMGDAMRNAEPPMSLLAPRAFLAGVMSGLPDADATRLNLESSTSAVHVRAPAANDAVMRWKMLAGVASVAAVVAVSWSVLSGAPGAPVNGVAGGAQLAAAGTQAQAQAPVALVAQPVAVRTAQGTLIRDARLEQLLAEHRQFGGASALQMPAGFLRDATYEAAPQR